MIRLTIQFIKILDDRLLQFERFEVFFPITYAPRILLQGLDAVYDDLHKTHVAGDELLIIEHAGYARIKP